MKVDRNVGVGSNVAGDPRWIVLVVAFSLAMPVKATSIVVIRRPDKILIAADSLGIRGTPYIACKIHHEGNMFYAGAGIVGDTASGFSIETIALRIIKGRRQSIATITRQFIERTEIPFAKALLEIKRDYPEFFEREVRNKPEPLQVIFVSDEKSVPTFGLAYFTCTRMDKGLLSQGIRSSAPAPHALAETRLNFWERITPPESSAKRQDSGIGMTCRHRGI